MTKENTVSNFYTEESEFTQKDDAQNHEETSKRKGFFKRIKVPDTTQNEQIDNDTDNWHTGEEPPKIEKKGTSPKRATPKTVLLALIFIISGILTIFASFIIFSQESPIELSLTEINPDNNGKLAYLQGDIITDELKDEILKKTVDAVELERYVETFQWQQKEDGGYEKIWAEELINYQNFSEPSGHYNPIVKLMDNKKYKINDVLVGRYILSPSLFAKISDKEQVSFSEEDFNKLPEEAKLAFKLHEGKLFFGLDPQNPNIGDTRIGFKKISGGPVSILATQQGRTIVGYFTEDGSRRIEEIRKGTHDLESMLPPDFSSGGATFKFITIGIGMLLLITGILILARSKKSSPERELSRRIINDLQTDKDEAATTTEKSKPEEQPQENTYTTSSYEANNEVADLQKQGEEEKTTARKHRYQPYVPPIVDNTTNTSNTHQEQEDVSLEDIYNQSIEESNQPHTLPQPQEKTFHNEEQNEPMEMQSENYENLNSEGVPPVDSYQQQQNPSNFSFSGEPELVPTPDFSQEDEQEEPQQDYTPAHEENAPSLEPENHPLQEPIGETQNYQEQQETDKNWHEEETPVNPTENFAADSIQENMQQETDLQTQPQEDFSGLELDFSANTGNNSQDTITEISPSEEHSNYDSNDNSNFYDEDNTSTESNRPPVMSQEFIEQEQEEEIDYNNQDIVENDQETDSHDNKTQEYEEENNTQNEQTEENIANEDYYLNMLKNDLDNQSDEEDTENEDIEEWNLDGNNEPNIQYNEDSNKEDNNQNDEKMDEESNKKSFADKFKKNTPQKKVEQLKVDEEHKSLDNIPPPPPKF